MSAPPDEEGTSTRAGLAEALLSPDHYGLVLLLIVLTYILSVTLTQGWAGSLVLAVQMTTVWIVLRTSEAPRRVRVVAGVALLLALVAAVLGIVLHQGISQRFLPAVSSLLYLIAPFAIARHLLRRSAVDLQTVLGGAGHLPRSGCPLPSCTGRRGPIRRVPSSGRGRIVPARSVLLVHDTHHHRVRKSLSPPGPRARRSPSARCSSGNSSW